MTPMDNQLPAGTPSESDSTPPAVVPPSQPEEGFLLGPQGLRAGWKFLIFWLLYEIFTNLSIPLIQQIPGLDFHPNAMQPVPMLFFELVRAANVLIPTFLMAKLIDRKPWGHFGIPLRRAFRRDFWIGAAIGVGTLVLQLALMHLGGWFDFGTLQLRGPAILQFGLLWFAVFLGTGFFEEGLFRGYPLRALTNGIGFWPAALFLSLVFGLVHLQNSGETAFGIFMIVVDGLVMCFSIWRTGDLWFAIGNHAAWDWAQTFLFGTPDSGTRGVGALMHPSFHGPTLLSGGTDGPEGSVLVLLAEAAMALMIALLYRRRKYSLPSDPPEPGTAAVLEAQDSSQAHTPPSPL